MKYQTIKTYGHEVGLSCCFRQWRAESHCRFLHGYAIAVELVFEAEELDHRNWVMDFGGLKSIKQFLTDTFDHKLLIAADDPSLDLFQTMEALGLVETVLVTSVGCEAFAKLIFEEVSMQIRAIWKTEARVRLTKVTVKEHGANAASYGV